jgi:hypothetical protein
MRVIEGVVQPGGWHYEQPLDSGQKQRIEGRTYRELVDRTHLFRLQHLELVKSGSATKEQVESDRASVRAQEASYLSRSCRQTRATSARQIG